MSEAELHVLRGAAARRHPEQGASRRAARCGCRSAWSTTPKGAWRWIPISRSRRACGSSFATFQRTGSAHGHGEGVPRAGPAVPATRLIAGPHKGDAGVERARPFACAHGPAQPALCGRLLLRPLRAAASIPTAASSTGSCRARSGTRSSATRSGLHHLGGVRAEQAAPARKRAGLGAEREQGPPREGPALLQGLMICGHVR